MHSITKSLFVGAAIAGIGMSSGKAELKIPQSLKNEIYHVVERRLKECYRQVRLVVPDIDYGGFWKQWCEEDTKHVYDLIMDPCSGFFGFYSLEISAIRSHDQWKKEFKCFFEEHCPIDRDREMVRFFDKLINRETLHMFRTLRGVIHGDYGFNKRLRKNWGRYWSYLPEMARKGIIIDDNGRNGYCGYSVEHSFVFNDEFIERIADIIHNSMTVVNKMYEVTTVKGVTRLENPVVNNVVKMYLKGVQQLYCRYLVIKNSPRDINTIGACNKFIREAEKLAVYDRRIASFCSKNYKYTADWLCSQDEGAYMNGVLFNAVGEIGELMKAVEDIRDELTKFSDPYYFKPEDTEQNDDILKELEESNAEKGKDAPNAFLEQVD